jgi:hypothetical protein
VKILKFVIIPNIVCLLENLFWVIIRYKPHNFILDSLGTVTFILYIFSIPSFFILMENMKNEKKYALVGKLSLLALPINTIILLMRVFGSFAAV